MAPTLPIELVQHIITLSLPEKPTFATYQERYRSLLVYSLVHSAWYALAQKELHRVLWVRASDDLLKHRLLAKARKSGGGQQLNLGNYFRTFHPKEAQLPPLPRVNKLTLTRLVLCRKDLTKLRDVEMLHLQACELGDEEYDPCYGHAPLRRATFPCPPVFAHLHTLSLIDARLFPTNFPSWALWLTPINFPLLQHLSLTLENKLDDGGGDPTGLTTSLQLLGPQLKTFLVHWDVSDDDLSILPWEAMTGLERLSLFPAFLRPLPLLPGALRYLPAGLPFLRIGHPDGPRVSNPIRCASGTSREEEQEAQQWDQAVFSQCLAMALDEDCPVLRQLKVLEVEGCAVGMRDGVLEDIQKVEKAMEERGCRFVRRFGWEGGWNHLHWERHMPPW